MNILTTEIDTKLGIQMKNTQMKHHENYIKIDDEPKKQHPIIRQRYKLNKGKYSRIRVDTSVLVQYMEKHSIRILEFERFTKISQQTTEILFRMDLKYKYMTSKVVRKIADYFYNNMEEEFKIDIKQLISDEWEDFTNDNT